MILHHYKNTCMHFWLVILALVVLAATTHAFAAEPAYIDGLPTAKTVLSRVRGKDSLDTAAAQVGVLDQLLSKQNPQETPSERRLFQSYKSAENHIIATVQSKLSHEKTSATGRNTPWAKWVSARWTYQDYAPLLKGLYTNAPKVDVAVLSRAQAYDDAAGRRAQASDAALERAQQATSQGKSQMSRSETDGLILLAVLAGVFLAHLRLNADATKFTAGLRRWKLTNITGRVGGYRSDTSVHSSGGYRTGDTVSPVRVTSTLHENVRLELPNGRKLDTQMEDFGFPGQEGDVVTVCLASRWGTQRTFAVLNHTTNQSRMSETEIFSMGTGGRGLQSLKAIAMLLFAVGYILTPLFNGSSSTWYVGLAPFGVWALRAIFIYLFSNKWTNRLWDVTATDAQELIPASSSLAT